MTKVSRHRQKIRPSLRGLRLDSLGQRCLLSGAVASTIAPEWDVEPNDVLSQAYDLGTLTDQQLTGLGTIEDGLADSSDVDWYSFTLSTVSDVNLSAFDADGISPFLGTISLFNNDPNSFSDPFSAGGSRLLTQVEGGEQSTLPVNTELSAGTYYIAVSASGNRDFNPYLADTGVLGLTSNYQLSVSVSSLTEPIKTIISSQPSDGDQIASSPLVIRVQLNASIDVASLLPDTTVTLAVNDSGDFLADPGQIVPTSWLNFSTDASELQLAPMAALPPGFYHLVLHGDSSTGQPVLTDLQGIPFGTDTDHPLGNDLSINFQVTGIEGNSQANDALSTAIELGDLSLSGTSRSEGIIGDDPSYSPNDPNLPASPGADVDYYHFQITGSGLYALDAEVFAGRIGSRLDPGLSLFKLDPIDGLLHLITANEDTQNGTTASNGLVPLFTDPAVFAGLTSGDYYLVVSSRNNTPDPLLGLTPGVDGIFDPNVPHSSVNGSSVGKYVLSASIRPAGDPPEVVQITLDDETPINEAPTDFQVQFSQPVNLLRLASASFSQPNPGELSTVYIQSSDGTIIYPRLVNYDDSTNTATFLMLDRLPTGSYELHLAGTKGLTDFADQPLTGNSESGDYVSPFLIENPADGNLPDPLTRTTVEPNDLSAPQDLGVLFPHELQTGIAISRAQATVSDQDDCFQFSLLQSKTYVFTLNQTGLVIELFDDAGNPIEVTASDTGDSVQVDLQPGIYVIRISGWAEADSQSVSYRLSMALGTSADNPPPLTIGPRPTSVTNLVNATNRLVEVPVTPPQSIVSEIPPIVNTPVPVVNEPTETAPEQPKTAVIGVVRKPSEVTATTNGITPLVPAVNNPLANTSEQNSEARTNSNTPVSEDSCSSKGIVDASSPGNPFLLPTRGEELVAPDSRLLTVGFRQPVSTMGIIPSADGIRVLPASLLNQLGAGPVGGIGPEMDPVELTRLTNNTSELSAALEESQVASSIVKSTNDSDNGTTAWIKNTTAFVMLCIIGGGFWAKRKRARIVRQPSKPSLLRESELIEIVN